MCINGEGGSCIISLPKSLMLYIINRAQYYVHVHTYQDLNNICCIYRCVCGVGECVGVYVCGCV